MSKMAILIYATMLLFSYVLAGDKEANKRENPREALENLGKFFEMMSGGKNGTCVLTCPEGLVPVPRKGHIPSSNGCGSMGIMLDTTLFPGFEVCCDAHDKCYDTCNTKREKCDTVFNSCLDSVCVKAKATQSNDRVQLCDNAAGVMQATATGLGCSSFKQAQEKACICTANAIADESDDDIIDDDDSDDDSDDDDNDVDNDIDNDVDNDMNHELEEETEDQPENDYFEKVEL